jgi:hypothetical protein
MPLLPLLAAAALSAQSVTVHSGTTRDSFAVADLDSVVFRDITADDATLLAYTKTGSKSYKTRAVDSVKTAAAPSGPDTGKAAVGLLWMFLGDSQTSGRATGEVTSHVTAFRAIWDRSFPAQANEEVHINGESGRILSATAAYYGTRSDRGGRTWVHFQESGGQAGGGQGTAEEFGATWEAFVRKVKAESPSAVISTETAFSFGREGEAGRNWEPYNVVLRQKLAALAKDGIKVRLAEVDRNIKALDAAVGARNVWFQSDEANLYHYKGLGNLMVALSIFDALGYDVKTLDLGGITSVTAADKSKCVEIVSRF